MGMRQWLSEVSCRTLSIFVYEPDLLFSSKFDGISRLVRRDFSVFADLTLFLESARSGKPEAFIINLDAMDLDDLRYLVTLRLPVLGYFSHVNNQVARAALSAGLNSVVPRRNFVVEAERLVRELLN